MITQELKDKIADSEEQCKAYDSMKLCKNCKQRFPESEMEREDVCVDCIDEVEEKEQEELLYQIEEGDLVDFGSYGKLYVVKLNAGLMSEDMMWVTDQRENRDNKDARGWYIKNHYAKRIIEKYDSGEGD